MVNSKRALYFILVLLIGGAALIFIGSRVADNQLVIPGPSQLSPLPTPSLSDLIILEEPLSGQVVKSPLLLRGRARGYWYFEASFPAKILDENGVELGIIPVQASGDPVKSPDGDNGVNWMTEDFVPFTANLVFKKPSTANGFLVLEKDNPSGLPENANELRIPVVFDLKSWDDAIISPSESPRASGGCKITGCSGQLCSDEDTITTCEFKAEYACYQTAKCDRQEDGKCGWTPTEELVACLGAAFQAESEAQ